MFLIVLVAICCVVYAFWTWMKPQHASPPMYPGALPLIGHAYHLIGVSGDPIYFWELFKKVFHFSLNNGDVIQIRLGPLPVYVITDTDDLSKLANSSLDKPYFYEFGKEKFSSGLTTASLSTWKPHRRLLNPAFINLQVLNTFLSEFNTQSRNLVSLLATEVGQEPFNVQRYLVKSLLKTVCQTSLGLEKPDQDVLDKDYAIAIEELFNLFVERMNRFWLHLPFTFNWSSLKNKQDKLLKITNDIMNKIIFKRKLELKANKDMEENTKTAQEKFKPLMDQLLELAKTQDAFTDDEIRGHLETFVVGAFDTTSTAMTYALLLVGSKPDIQERIFKEIQTVLENQDRDITKDDLLKLPYLEAVLKETMRLYPPIPVVARSIQSDVQLKNYIIPAGSTCIIGIYGMNHHPKWGADVEQFRPERWLDPTSLPENPNAFASFSLGRRNCIGRLYAMMVMKTMLAHVFRRYRVISEGDNIQTQYAVMIKPVSSRQIRLELRT